jgi:putative heme-binding domain-containing protein
MLGTLKLAVCAVALLPLIQPAAAQEKPFGISKRVSWTTSKITGSPEPPKPYVLERVFPKLTFENPVDLVAVPNSNQMLVLEVNGKVWSFDNNNGTSERHLVCDLKSIDGVTRVYGIAFHPKFEQNRSVFLCYVLDANNPVGSKVIRVKASSVEPLTVDLSKREIVLEWVAGGHNGGSLQFGPHDGMLYVSTGDSGPAFPPDPKKTGQDVSDLMASILRIDVDHAANGNAYSIPKDNPFVDLKGARGEIWSYGHRNPWRMSFDPVTHDLWVGDVGWEMWEMIYRVKPGDNYGWSMLEHTQQVHPERLRGPTPIVPPTAAHDHTESRSITGGHVYRGDRLSKLTSTYVYGDYVTGKLWGIGVDGQKLTKPFEVVNSSIQVICFGVDHNKELFVVGYDGSINRLIENPATQENKSFPKTLASTGLFANAKDHKLAAGVIPYSINAEPWADGTIAERFIAIPGNGKLGVHDTNNVQKGNLKGEWNYPVDTVIGKTIMIELESGNPKSRRRLETQILHRGELIWNAYSFIWNADQTDARLSNGRGFDQAFEIADQDAQTGKRRQTWHFASRSECLTCHTTRGGSVYGFTPDQLNRDFDYGNHSDNQLRTFAHLGLFEQPLVNGDPVDAPSVEKLPKMVAPHDGLQSLTKRVRSYLHVNCAHCHRRGGGGTAAMDIQKQFALDKTNIISRPTQGTFGLLDAWLVSPGDPYRSTVYYRMSKLGKGRMPHFGSQVVDVRGIRLMHDWIEQLSAKPGTLNAAPATESQIKSLAKLQSSNEQSLLLLTGGLGVTQKLKTAAIDRLLSSTSGALMLASFVRGFGRDLDPAINQQAIARGVAHSDAVVRDLFEPFIPEENRTKRLGTSFDPLKLLAMKGSSAKGRELFFNSKTLQCRTCHQVGDKGKELGPKFDMIGKKYSRAEILENILDPSKKIDPKFRTWLVETDRGRVFSGLLVKRTDAEIQLKDATGKSVSIKTGEIELLIAQQKSLMPELLLKDMTEQEVADLLAFLAELK